MSTNYGPDVAYWHLSDMQAVLRLRGLLLTAQRVKATIGV